MIDLYYFPTPNTWKISIFLEETGLDYQLINVNILQGEQFDPTFLAVSPNNRVPAIVDHDPLGGGPPLSIFESGAILVYLAEKTGKLMPREPGGRSVTLQWLFFQVGGIGPMMGQANVFYRYFPEKIQPAIDRYQSEGRRLFEVLDTQLADHEFLAGDYSIADMANWSWVRTHRWSGVDIEGLDHLSRWMGAVGARPGVQRGVRVPVDIAELMDAKRDEDAQAFARNARSMVLGAQDD